MMIRIVLALVVCCALVEALPTSGVCSHDHRCTTDGDCYTDATIDNIAYCCNGQCTNGRPTSKIGEVCGPYCAGSCPAGLSCDSNRCQRLGHNIGCACTMDSECITNVCNNATMTCDYAKDNKIPSGGSCTFDNQCRSSECTDGVCSGLADGETCAGSFLFQCANTGSYCVSNSSSVGSYYCGAQRAAGEYCVRTRDCASGLACNSTSNECVAVYSMPTNTPCTSSLLCESRTCLSNKCGYSWYGQNSGEPCHGSADCRLDAMCIGTEDKVCANVAGKLCNLDGSTPSGNADCKCQGSYGTLGTGQRARSGNCEAERAEVYRFFSGLPTLTYIPDIGAPDVVMWTNLPEEVQSAVANYLCCYYSSGFGGVADAVYGASQMGYTTHKLDCSDKTWTAIDFSPNANNGDPYPACTLYEAMPNNDLVSNLPIRNPID